MNTTNLHNIPDHLAIMMDGNGRWAKKRMLPRKAGHVAGAKTLEKISRCCDDIGIKYLTIFAFSTENWKRPKEEVEGIMNLFRDYLKNDLEKTIKNNLHVTFIGNRAGLAPDLVAAMENMEQKTKDCTGMNVQFAVNYGGKDEIVRAVNRILASKFQKKEITIEDFITYLDTASIPEPDLFIRTGGDKRLSNFMLWEMAYTEFYFSDALWPDFNEEELLKALGSFSKRERRYGRIEEE